MKITLVIFAVIVVAIVLLCAFAPRDFQIERDITINVPKNKVFGEIKFLKNHEQWNAWSKKDPNAKREYKGTDGAVGFISSWESDIQDLGTAEQEIIGIQDGEKFETQIRFKKPFEAKFSSYVTTESTGENQTKVTIGMYDKMPVPMNAISLIVNVCLGNQKKIIQNMDDSLSHLKSHLEK